MKFPNREQKKTGASSKGKKKHAEVDMGDPEQVLCRTIIIYFKLGNAIQIEFELDTMTSGRGTNSSTTD